MLHKTEDVSHQTNNSESLDVKDCDDGYNEKGYLWLCALCSDQPTFESIYDLFRHKNSHNSNGDSVDSSINKLNDEENPNSTDFADEDCLESNEIAKVSQTEVDCIVNNEKDSGEISPVPSVASEDIPLADLLPQNSQIHRFKSTPVKKVGKNREHKSKSQKSTILSKISCPDDEDSITEREKSPDEEGKARDETTLGDKKEEKENQEVDVKNSCNVDLKSEKECEAEEDSDEKNNKEKVKHICKICNTGFPKRGSLSVHKKTHLYQDTGCYKCETCGKMCPKYDNFTRHLTIHFTNRQKSHHCPQCFASFYNYADLKRHSVLHLAVKPYKCEHCGEGFVKQDNLLIHEYKHTGIQYRKFACKDCDKVLNSPSALVMHIKTHSVKTVFCPEPGCTFSCYLQSQLRQHIRKHSGEKPFQCAKCGKCFARSNDMKNHILNVHEGVKPYKCSSCPKKFALIGNLKNHKVVHTNERPFLCAQCGKSFNQSSTLRKHSVIVHNPCRVDGRSKRSKNPKKEVEECQRDKEKLEEFPESQSTGGKPKGQNAYKTEPPDEMSIEKPKDGEEFMLSGAPTIRTTAPIPGISTQTQLHMPQITVSLQLDHPQTVLFPTVLLESSLIKPEGFVHENS